PRHEDAVDLEPEVVVEPGRAVALDDVPARARATARDGSARRLGRLPEVALALVFLERHQRQFAAARPSMSRPVRTLLAAIVLAALIVTGVAIVAPLIARPIIVAAIQGESPFGDQHLDIDVDCNVFGLLQGSIDRVHVHGTNLKRGDVTIGALDISLTDVATSGHA